MQAGGQSYSVQIQNPRNYKLAVFDDPGFAVKLWEKIRGRAATAIEAFAARDACGEPLGLNRRLRILKYTDQVWYLLIAGCARRLVSCDLCGLVRIGALRDTHRVMVVSSPMLMFIRTSLICTTIKL